MNGRRLLPLVLFLSSVSTFPLASAAETSPADVDAALGRKGKPLPPGVVKYAWPRSDLSVKVSGIEVDPSLALTSWAAFLRTGAAGPTLVMGDLVLLCDEVAPVVRPLHARSLDGTASHT